MKVSKLIKIGLLILLVGTCVKLIYTFSDWYPYNLYLSGIERMKADELKEEIEFVKHQSKYLHPHINKDSLNIWYCEEYSCIDSLESQLIRKDTIFMSYFDREDVHWKKHDFSRWDKLKYLFRLESHLELYYYTAWYWECGLEWPFTGKVYNYLTDSVQVVQFELDLIKNNNILTYNNDAIQIDTSYWFKVPYEDTIRIKYFKDNYSYAMGGDSIIKEYVLDASHLKSE